ncbi:hypothetical protein ABZ825_35195 [Streptomyces tauricus]|uniref:RraA family protein n=1 Tax=Streptomyces tauricus TaxID=68274 RepID=UPI0034002AEB
MSTVAAGDERVPTAAIANASVYLNPPVRWAPPSLRPLLPGAPFSGPARPVTHLGSADSILEVIAESDRSDVLVIDHGGRREEECIAGLRLAEAALAGIAGIVLCGAHRDTAQLRHTGLPLFSLGSASSGPRRYRPWPRRYGPPPWTLLPSPSGTPSSRRRRHIYQTSPGQPSLPVRQPHPTHRDGAGRPHPPGLISPRPT